MRYITKIKAKDFCVICELDNKKSYKYDMSFVNKETGPAIDPLKDLDFFKKVFIDSGALAWPNGYEIHADTVEKDGTPVEDYQEA